MKKLLFILYIGTFSILSVYAQYQRPPDITTKTIRYKLPVLLVNNVNFFYDLDSLISNSGYEMNEKTDKYLRITIRKNGEIIVELSNICGDASVTNKGLGYIEYNNLIYIIMGENLNNLFTVTEKKKCFIYQATMYGDIDVTEDDLPIWILKYEKNKLILESSP